jgi:hypothetical protein
MPKEFVYIEAMNLNGISEKTGKPYELRKLRFADPLTYENHQLDFAEGLTFGHIQKGERFTYEWDLRTGYGNQDSRPIVTAVNPIKVKI